MRAFILANEWRIVVSATAVACTISGAFFGFRGSAGMLMGVLGAGFNFWILWAAGNLVGGSVHDGESVRAGTAALVFSFLLKLPVLVMLGIVIQRLGGHALGCFVVGLTMVYFAAIGWGCAHS